MEAGCKEPIAGKSRGELSSGGDSLVPAPRLSPTMLLRLDEIEAASAGVGEDNLALRGTFTVRTFEFFPHLSEE